MLLICPECGQKYKWIGSGICPCSDEKDHKVYLLPVEEDVKKIIKYTGNTDRFTEQKTAILLRAELQIVKEMSRELQEHVGQDAIPRGSAILCTYLGDKGIAFSELRNYGCHALGRLRNMVGESFAIDAPPSEKQEKLDI